MSRSRMVNDILRRQQIRAAEEQEQHQRNAMWLATMQGVANAIDHAQRHVRNDDELLHPHPSHRRQTLATNFPSVTQRTLPSKHSVPTRVAKAPTDVKQFRAWIDPGIRNQMHRPARVD